MKLNHYHIVIDNTVSTKQFLNYFEPALNDFISEKRSNPFDLECTCLSLYLVNNNFTKVNDNSDISKCEFGSHIKYSQSTNLKLVPVIKEVMSEMNPNNRNYLYLCVDGLIEDYLELKLYTDEIQRNFQRSIGFGIGPIADVSTLCHICDGVYQDKEIISRLNHGIDIDVIDTFKWFLNSIIHDISADVNGPMDIIIQPSLPYIKTIKPPTYA